MLISKTKEINKKNQLKNFKFDYLPELLVKLLADTRQFNKLQQLLQHRVIDDSKFLAYELLTLATDYPPLRLMAMDMLARRGNHEQIAEVIPFLIFYLIHII